MPNLLKIALQKLAALTAVDPMAKREDDAYHEGYKIGDAGKLDCPINPYPAGSRLAEAWQGGYDDSVHAQLSIW